MLTQAPSTADYRRCRPLESGCMIGNFQIEPQGNNRARVSGFEGTLGFVWPVSSFKYLITAGHVLNGLPTPDVFQPPVEVYPEKSGKVYIPNDTKIATKHH